MGDFKEGGGNEKLAVNIVTKCDTTPKRYHCLTSNNNNDCFNYNGDCSKDYNIDKVKWGEGVGKSTNFTKINDNCWKDKN